MNASSSSKLPVKFKLTSGSATLSGDTVILNVSRGYVNIKASQDGDGVYCKQWMKYKDFCFQKQHLLMSSIFLNVSIYFQIRQLTY